MSKTLVVGNSLNIQRTDGRVHSAVISSVNKDTRTVTVEWFEQGETKGKEIDMKILEEINPEINFNPNHDTSGSSEEEPVSDAPSVNSLTNNRATNGLQPSASSATVNHESTTRSRPSVTVLNSRKRSQVVKEVEKLQKNREERRQRQAEEKAEKEAFLQMAPGNPYWELMHMIIDYRKGLDIKPLNIDQDAVGDHLITVCVRKRPLNGREAAKKEVDVITIPSKNQLILHEPKNKVDLTKYLENQIFRFDFAFDETCTNEIVYKYTAQPLIKTIFDGGFATCFAYGQTGSGKTHTMGGEFTGKSQDCQKGIYALATTDVFKFVSSPTYKRHQFVVCASFFEIYSGKVFDLLNNKAKLRILEDGKQQVVIVGLTETVVGDKDQVLKLIKKGNQARTSGQTSANANSSRSHAVFQIILRTKNNLHKIHGKFSLIDLAGNERGADTSSADRQTRLEGAEINKSLLALKECIRALGRRGAHLPFRVSKLTQVLRDSFVGPNSRTCMIAMVSPGVASCEHTLNTLRYADRVKELVAGDLNTNQGDNFDKQQQQQPQQQQQQQQQQSQDLLQLSSLNETDMTPAMLNFHQVVSELQIAEENTLENHKETIEHINAIGRKLTRLLRTTDDVQYDVEDYCKNLEILLSDGMTVLKRSLDILGDLKLKIAKEEQLSQSVIEYSS